MRLSFISNTFENVIQRKKVLFKIFIKVFHPYAKAGSAVFDALFNGGIASREEEIKLPDVEHAAFLALLRFLYTDEVRIGPETVMTTLYTAKKYAVPALDWILHTLQIICFNT